MKNHYRVRFTTHAIDRLTEAQIPIKKGVYMVHTSMQEKLEQGLKKNKNIYNKHNKYINNKGEVSYWRNGTLVFVIRTFYSERWKEWINLVITVTDQRVMLPGSAFF